MADRIQKNCKYCDATYITFFCYDRSNVTTKKRETMHGPQIKRSGTYTAKYKCNKCDNEWEQKYDAATGKETSCFITTATLHSLKTNDNSYELNSFRNFRDNWLLNQEDGKAIIEEYYGIAPIIVSSINKNENNNKIYKKIYIDYLSKALHYIENKQYEQAKATYIKMVRTLKKEYI